MRGTTPAAASGGTALHVDGGHGRRTARFRATGGTALDHERADATLAAALLPAMRTGEDLVLDGPVSPRLLAAVDTVQAVFTTWDRTLRPTAPWYQRVTVTDRSDHGDLLPADPGRGTAAFFTGGVDSLHTAVVHRDEIDALVFVHGFDVPLDRHALRAAVSRRVGEAARLLGLPVVEIETDLREVGEAAGVPWPDYHGAALACVALLLAPGFSRVLVPATHTYGHLEGLGSHPLLDPLWSTDRVEVVHDGADATRVEKVRRLAEEPAARRHLRVCWENPGDAYNCGRCEKCVRTGVAVRIAGVEGRFPTIASPTLRQVAATRITGRGADWHDLRAELQRVEGSDRLRGAIDLALARHQLGRWRWTRRIVP